MWYIWVLKSDDNVYILVEASDLQLALRYLWRKMTFAYQRFELYGFLSEIPLVYLMYWAQNLFVVHIQWLWTHNFYITFVLLSITKRSRYSLFVENIFLDDYIVRKFKSLVSDTIKNAFLPRQYYRSYKTNLKSS